MHLVDEIMDHGEVIIQAAVPAIAGEPLEDPAAYSELVCTLI